MTRPASSAVSTHSGSSPNSDHQGVPNIKWSPPKSSYQHHHPHHHQQQQQLPQHHNVSPTVAGGDSDDFGGRESPMNSDSDIQSPVEPNSNGSAIIMSPLLPWSTHNNHHPHHLQQQHHQQHHHHLPTSSGAPASSAPTSFLGLGLNGLSTSVAGRSSNGQTNTSPSFRNTNGDLNNSYGRVPPHGDMDMLQNQQHQLQHQQQQPPASPSSPQIPPGVVVPTVLSPETPAVVVAAWLVRNRFANYVRVFNNFSGEDILRLTREDFIQVWLHFKSCLHAFLAMSRENKCTMNKSS